MIQAVAVRDHFTPVRLAAFSWLELSPRHPVSKAKATKVTFIESNIRVIPILYATIHTPYAASLSEITHAGSASRQQSGYL